MPDTTTFGPQGWTPDRLGSQKGKTFLITGANAGTGFEAARILLGKGAKVVMLNRSADKSTAAIAELQEEFGPDAEVSFVRTGPRIELDSVRTTAAEVLETVPRDRRPHLQRRHRTGAHTAAHRRRLRKHARHEPLRPLSLLTGLLFERIEESKGRIVVVASLGYKMGIKTIQFDDMNWDGNYHQNKTYSQSKLAQMMFAYELQDRLAAANRDVEVYVCHPGSSRTSLITTSGNLMTRIMFRLMSMSPMVQSAEKGAYPEVMCATEDGLDLRELYGPTGSNEWVGPVGKGTLEPYAYDKATMERLWDLSETETGFNWKL